MNTNLQSAFFHFFILSTFFKGDNTMFLFFKCHFHACLSLKKNENTLLDV